MTNVALFELNPLPPGDDAVMVQVPRPLGTTRVVA
jgi:hypothetical protein